MNQSFSNFIRQIYYACVGNPCLPPALMGCGTLIGAYIVAPWPWIYFLSLLWLLAFAVLERMIAHGRPKWLVMHLTPNFYALRMPRYRFIIQRQPRPDGDCTTLLRSILSDQDALPAALLPGRYRAITHDVILTRLQGLPNVAHIRIRPAYTAGVARMRGRKCKRCTTGRCFFRALGRRPRQFYDVMFEIL